MSGPSGCFFLRSSAPSGVEGSQPAVLGTGDASLLRPPQVLFNYVFKIILKLNNVLFNYNDYYFTYIIYIMYTVILYIVII